MPLIKSKSKKAFESNLKEELSEGKPKAQSLAIAYAMKKRNAKHMSRGGPVTAADEFSQEPIDSLKSEYSARDKHTPSKATVDRDQAQVYAQGGMVSDSDEHYSSIADAILAKKRNNGLENNANELPNYYDDLNVEATEHPVYDNPLPDFPEPEASVGDDIESDKNDRVSQMRKRMRSKGK